MVALDPNAHIMSYDTLLYRVYYKLLMCIGGDFESEGGGLGHAGLWKDPGAAPREG